MQESLIETRSEIWRVERCLRGKGGSQADGRFGSADWGSRGLHRWDWQRSGDPWRWGRGEGRREGRESLGVYGYRDVLETGEDSVRGKAVQWEGRGVIGPGRGI